MGAGGSEPGVVSQVGVTGKPMSDEAGRSQDSDAGGSGGEAVGGKAELGLAVAQTGEG
jgi:hypothetical protein